ncbi:Calx-beta domain-containing protein [Pararhodonellum marinum]|uniref:Calx-beta domain-containing protein n=1 Tax=Pararhodonellum marinum TaxID=2755358 RepID=UPI00188F5B7B|nr:Calx-beta domain-containing protein [Pararhodonellum marinum]
MKFKNLYTAMVVMMASLVTTACFDEPGFEILWDGLEVEIHDANLPNGVTRNFIRSSPEQVDVTEIQVNVVGAAQSSPITVNFEADPTSTAIAGVHYEFVTTTLTFQPGELVQQLPIRILVGNIDPDEEPDLVLNLTTATGAKVSANYASLRIGIRVICPSELAGAYSVFWTRLQTGDGSGGAANVLQNVNLGSIVNITEIGLATFRMDDMSFGLYPDGYGDAAPAGNFSDACGELQGDPSNVDQYSDPFTIVGTVGEEGELNFVWSNTWGDGGTVILTRE